MTPVSSVMLPTCKGPLEAHWPPAVGPIETLHLHAVRLSRLEKVGSAMVTLRASQGQNKRGNRSQQQMETSTFPDLRVSPYWLLCWLCCSCSACHSSQGCYSRIIYKGSGEKNGKMRLEGKRHIFSASDSVVRLWPSRGEEYAAQTLCTSGQGIGCFPD